MRVALDTRPARAIRHSLRALMARRSVPPPRWMSILVAALVLASPATSPVAGQTEPIQLLVKFERGETLYYHVVTSTEDSREPPVLPWLPRTVRATAEGRLAMRVLDVDPDGTMAVEEVIEDARVTTGGRVADQLDEPDTFKMRPDGEIVEVQGSEEAARALEFATRFPGHPLSVGDTWNASSKTRYLGATLEVTSTSTLTGVDRTDVGRVAHIRTRVEGTIKEDNQPRRRDAQVHMSGTERGSKEEVWSVEQGRLVQRRSEFAVDLHLTIVARGQTVRVHHTAHSTGRLDALPRDQVVVTAVGPDALIAPGKAVGAVALDQRIDDLTTRLGSPLSGGYAPDGTMWGADRGFRATAVGWPNGLVAYVDPQDQSALLGLGVAGRRFRTDQGLGVGSSRGAVLFAHAKPPTRVNMRFGSRSADAVLVLIYNDEGIAYAIAAEGQPSRAAPSRAPLGTVRWVVVFPPGSAGKIFPL